MVDKAKVVATAEQAQNAAREAIGTLPPAGYKRDETLRERQARLQEAAQQMADQMRRGTIDPSKLQVLNEIASRVHYMDVSDPQPGRCYVWVSTNRNSQHVQEMKSLGFQVVQGSDTEASELLDSGGSTVRRLGDVLLMWAPEDLVIALKAQQIVHQREVERSSTANLQELGDKYRSQGLIVRPFGMDTLDGAPIEVGRFTQNQARKAATGMIDTALRDGTIPGMQLPRNS